MTFARSAVCFALAALFGAAGVLHFTQTDAFAAIVPPFLPAPRLLVQLTGAAELVLAVLLVPQRTRAAAGAGLALYCAAVLPANINMALDPALRAGLSEAALWTRVALQLPLIALILWASGAAQLWRWRRR